MQGWGCLSKQGKALTDQGTEGISKQSGAVAIEIGRTGHERGASVVCACWRAIVTRLNKSDHSPGVRK